MKSVKAVMKNDGLQWNPKICAVTHTRRGVLFANSADVKVDGNAKIANLEEWQVFKFLGVLDCLRQEENLALWCAAKDYSRISLISSSPFSDYHSVIVSTQFAMLAIK